MPMWPGFRSGNWYHIATFRVEQCTVPFSVHPERCLWARVTRQVAMVERMADSWKGGGMVERMVDSLGGGGYLTHVWV